MMKMKSGDKPAAKPEVRSWNAVPESPNCVTVFGGGIAGLTAAHELVERGFHVQVWERQGDERHPERGCDVGGMARTQWSALDWPEVRPLDSLQVPEADFSVRRTRSIEPIAVKFYLRWQPGLFDVVEDACAPTAPEKAVPLHELHLEPPRGWTACHIRVRSYGVSELSPGERIRRAGVSAAALGADEVADRELLKNAQSRGFDFCYRVRNKRVFVSVGEFEHPDFDEIEVTWLDAAENSVGPVTRLRRHWAPGEVTSSLDVKAAIARLKSDLAKVRNKVVYAEVAARHVGKLDEAERDRRQALIVQAFNDLGVLVQLGQPGAGRSDFVLAEGVRVVVVLIDQLPYRVYEGIPEDIEVVIAFRVRERWIPGEHGYRFFPSFYHHLFDTMKRTPILEVADKSEQAKAQERAMGIRHPEPRYYVESGFTAFDNIRPTRSTAVASASGRRPSQISRSAVRSFEELRAYLNLVFDSRDGGGLGFTPRDAARLALKVLQFATACEARRKSYEEQSWWDFLDAESLSEGAQQTIQRLPEALVAMDARECDARTQWVPFIQILLDQVRPEAYRDGTLRGPTSEAWLIPWRRYLEAQGVEFIHGELEGFQLVEQKGTQRVWPRVKARDLRYSRTHEKAEVTNFLAPGYFVIAVSADQARRLAREYCELTQQVEGLAAPAEESDFVRARALGGAMGDDELAAELSKSRPRGDFRHFAGIQYYFAEDVYWLDGHVYFPDSRWGITSISQARFWQDKMDWEHGYRGVLSAIIGTWDVRGGKHRKTAWECTPEELAEEVWDQIKRALSGAEQRRAPGSGQFVSRAPPANEIPEPLFWYVDRSLEWRGNGYENKTPFLIAAPGRFEARPGSLEHGYTVEHGFVLAGYYTQTYTRIPSMEAANESARHAVNAILQHQVRSNGPSVRFRRSYCDVWNPEDREVDDLRFLKDLDDRLMDRGLPHLFEIFGADYVAEHLLRGGASDPLDPLRLLTRLRRMVRDAAE